MSSFAAIGIRGDILKGLDTLGVTVPTPVQEKVIPLFIERQSDLVGLAQTGTGKTAAFGVPLIQLTDVRRKKIQALVLCPTRELCVQVARDMGDYSRYVAGMKITAVYGGASIIGQINELRKGSQIVVATPGRLLDLIRRRNVDISAIQSLVLDEADEMLQMGFQDELNAILAETPASKNTLLFSATMPKELAKIAGKYMKDPVEVTIGRRNAGAENVRHIYYTVQARDRYAALKRIVDLNPNMYSIIFCRTRQETKDIADKLIQEGYRADALHGDLSQGQRDHVMKKFRRKNLQMLVATDVAARGLDVKDLTHVVNYNLPDEIAAYTHRSGRTGRAGKTGISIAIVHMREKHKIREIEKMLSRKFEQGRIPTGHEICEKQVLSLIDSVKQVGIDHERIAPFLSDIYEILGSLDREELIQRFVSVEFNRFLEYYKNAPDLNVSAKEKKGSLAEREKGGSEHKPSRRQKFTRFLLNVGKRDGIHPARLIGEINEAAGNSKIKIGKIEIMHNSAMLEADSKFTQEIVDVFEHLMINGRAVSVTIAGNTMGPKRSTKFNRRKPLKSIGFRNRKKGGGGKRPFSKSA